MNMTYFPHFPRVQQELLPPESRRKTQEEVIQGFSEEQAVEEAGPLFQLRHLQRLRQLLSGLSRAVHRCVRSVRTASTRFWSTTAKAAACASRNVPTGCLEGVPELDFDTGVVRMDTAFAISPGLHGRQAAGTGTSGGAARRRTFREG